MDFSKAAKKLEDAERRVKGIEPFSRYARGLTDNEAWVIAAERNAQRRRAGEKQTGYKLGWTSQAMREALGIEKPNFGYLWDGMRLDQTIQSGRFIHPKAEPEFAFRAETELSGPNITAHDVVMSGLWAVAIEVVDPRWKSYEFTWADNTADGSSAAAYVTSSFTSISSKPEDLTLKFAIGEDVQFGHGSAAMGSPAEAVAYLVNELHRQGEPLRKGMIVLTGGVTAPVELKSGMTLKVDSPQIGECEARCV